MSVNMQWNIDEFEMVKSYQRMYRKGLANYDDCIVALGSDLGITDRKVLESIMDSRY